MKIKYKILFFIFFIFNGNIALAECISGTITVQPYNSAHTFSFDSSIKPSSNIAQYRILITEKIVCKANKSSSAGNYAELILRVTAPSCSYINGEGIVFSSNINGLTWLFPRGIPFNCSSKKIELLSSRTADANGYVTWNPGELDYRIFLRQDNSFDFSKSRTFSVNSISGSAGLDGGANINFVGSSFNYTYTNAATCTLTAPSEINFNTVTTSNVLEGKLNRNLDLRAECQNRGASLGLSFKFEPEHKNISANQQGIFYAKNSTGSLGYKLTKQGDSSIIPLNEFIKLVGEDKVNINAGNTIKLLLTLQKGDGKIATGKVETFLKITMEHM
ncbi:fimbrial protein [Providencia rustigianii]|uniref:Uncharacterized protein n=1 Tax=Providencia rustigianii DSM 4541 TaxID=500637 RepID=D1P767_9GAMM|nr:fimbrial protein [Providencia rustigianii]EFB70914.1 putative protein FanF [Providencia rustigianii DSM 4541]SUC25515.1 Uncharacterised protein [Providencia rustigianii]